MCTVHSVLIVASHLACSIVCSVGAFGCILILFLRFCLFNRSFWSHLDKLKCNEVYVAGCAWRCSLARSSATHRLNFAPHWICVFAVQNFISTLSILYREKRLNSEEKEHPREETFELETKERKKCRMRETARVEMKTDEKYSMAIILCR